MQSQVSTGSDSLYKFWAWLEDNLKTIVIATAIFVGVFFVVSYYSYSQKQKEITAGQALSQAMMASSTGPQPAAYLKIVGEYPATLAGQRALLEAGAALFTAGQYPEAQAQLQKFLDKYPDNSLAPQAMLGVASCLDAQGKTELAIPAYQRAAGQTDNVSVTAYAKFALARTYDTQGKIAEAMSLYEEIARSYQGISIANDAGVRAMELRMKTPGTTPAHAAAPAAPFTLTH
jgi:predicted negative regulator of RcsB-dependent stress response